MGQKVLGREFEGDSPQCGEMSRSDRGDCLRQRNPFSKGFPSTIPPYTHLLLVGHFPVVINVLNIIVVLEVLKEKVHLLDMLLVGKSCIVSRNHFCFC